MKNHRSIAKGRLTSFLLITAFLVTAFGCGGEHTDFVTPDSCDEVTGTCEAHVFLEVEEFEFLRQNGAYIIDTRSQDEYLQGHVPGAISGNWRAFTHPERNGLLWEEEEKLQQAVRDLGIKNDDTVIVLGVGDGSGGDATAGRFYWTLQYLGHEDVYLVNGGFQAWVDGRFGNLQAGLNEPTKSDYTIDIRPERRATIDEVIAAIEEDTLRLVDTRTVEEWMGEEMRNNPHAGHIPEAVHYHWENVFDENGKLRPKEDIRQELEDLGIVDGTLTIPYCQSGVRSGFFYAVLKWLDYPEAKNYDGSWWEWSRAAEDGEVDYIIP